VAGFLEAVVVAAVRSADSALSDLVDFVALYMIVWASAGAAVGLVSWVACAVRGAADREDRRRAFHGSLLVSLIVLVIVAGYVNIHLLPTHLSARSLVVTGLITAGCGALWVLIYRTWRRRLGAVPRRFGLASPLAVLAVALVLFVAVGAPLTRTAGEYQAPPVDRGAGGPSVLFLFVDSMRADHLGCYGYERDTSETIDSLAAEGVLFAHAYSQGCRTKEASASVVTSLFPSTHGMHLLSHVLPDAYPTLMEGMRDAGYSTAIFSANPIVSPVFGFGRGTDFFYTEAPTAGAKSVVNHVARVLGWDAPRLHWVHTFIETADELVSKRHGALPYEGGGADELNAALLEWIDMNPDAPFFAFVHYMDPHYPYAPPPPYDDMFDPEYEGPKVTEYPGRMTMMLPFAEGEAIPERERQNMLAQYDGSIAYFDRELGLLLAALGDRGLLDDLLIVLTADHGDEFYDHRGWGHGQSLYEELIHVPLVLWHPDVLGEGMVVDRTVRHVDLMPTLLRAVGGDAGPAPAWDDVDVETALLTGVDLWPAISAGATTGPDLPVLAELDAGGHDGRALRVDDWKLIRARFASERLSMLFDPVADPLEQDDLAGERPDVVDSLSSLLDRTLTALQSLRLSEDVDETTIDPAMEERLRALGYIE
jgi:arylsulfatase A-like enzyme